MRRTAAVLVAAAATAVLWSSPASATCMETFNDQKFTGIRSGSCSAPGGPPSSYVCYRDVECIWY